MGTTKPPPLPGFPLVTGAWWTDGDDLVVDDGARSLRAYLTAGAAAEDIARVLARCNGYTPLDIVLGAIRPAHAGAVLDAMHQLRVEGFLVDGRAQSRRLLAQLQRPIPVTPADIDTAYQHPLWRDAREHQALDVIPSGRPQRRRPTERPHSLPIQPPDEDADLIEGREIADLLASTYRTEDLWKPIASAGRLWPLVLHALVPTPSDYACCWFDPDAASLIVVVTGISSASVSSLIRQGGGLAAPERRFGVIVISADVSRVDQKYGNRGAWFSLLEAGAASHQIALSSADHSLGSRPLGGFDADAVRRLIGVDDVDPLLLMLLTRAPHR